MDVAIEELSELTRQVTITLPESAVKGRLDKEYERLRRESRMNGFRRGKVPLAMVKKAYQPQVEAEIGEKLVQETYFDIIEKQDFDVITHPNIKSIKYNDDGTFTYVAEVDVRPEFELGEYKGLEIEKPDASVPEEEIDKALASMQRDTATLKNVEDRPVQKDDIVLVDYQGFHNGHLMKQVKNEDYRVDVGSGRMGKEFEEKLIGMKKGEEASHEVPFTDTHPNPILRGKTVEFKIVVKDIKGRVLAPLDDDFAKDFEHETMQEFRDHLRSREEEKRAGNADVGITDRIMEKLLERHDFKVPEKLVIYEAEQMVKQTEEHFRKNDMDLESVGLDRDRLAKENMPIAEKRVRGDFILKKIADVEEIKVNDEDMDRGFKRIGDQYNMSVAKVKEFFGSRDDLLPLMNELLNEKVLNFLRQNTVLIDAPADNKANDEAS
ncbi:MAG: trigger factor [Deltaproteobacteria bacterium]|nr:MAG: trigger factor [Deltaproteobacteria bacterium]